MTHRLRLFIGVALLPLALFAFLPLVSSGQQKNLGSKIERKKDQIAWRKGRERVLSSDVAGYTRRINALQGDITVLQTKQVRLQAEPGPQARRARAHPGGPAPRAAAARPPARAAGRGARGALQAARRALQGRPARPRDRRARVQRLRRPARAHGVHAARLQPGRAHHRHRRARRRRRRPRPRSGSTSSRSARRSIANEIEGEVVQVTTVKDQLVDRRGRYADARSDKSTLLAQHARGPPFARGRPARARGRAGQGARRAAGLRARRGSAPAGPVRQGSGRLIWPVNASISSGFGYALGPPARGRRHRRCPTGTPIRAAAVGRVALAGWTGGYGNYTCIQHTGGAVHVLRATSRAIAVSVGASRLARARSSATSAARATDSAPHLHFEVRVGGTPWTRWATSRSGAAVGRRLPRWPSRGPISPCWARSRPAAHERSGSRSTTGRRRRSGPLDGWPQSLRTAVRIVLGSRFAMWMAWGPELTFFYNDAYAARHARDQAPVGARAAAPTRCGRRSGRTSARGSSRSSRPAPRPGTRACGCSSSAAATARRPTTRSPTARCGTRTGNTAGMLCVVVEETERVIGERRLATLRELAADAGAATTERELFAAVDASLSTQPLRPPVRVRLHDRRGRPACRVPSAGAPGWADAELLASAPAVVELAGRSGIPRALGGPAAPGARARARSTPRRPGPAGC